MSNPDTPTGDGFDLWAQVSPRLQRIETTPEAQVMLLMMRAAAKVVGDDAACEIWWRAAEDSLHDHPRYFRKSWVNARRPFGNHAPKLLDPMPWEQQR